MSSSPSVLERRAFLAGLAALGVSGCGPSNAADGAGSGARPSGDARGAGTGAGTGGGKSKEKGPGISSALTELLTGATSLDIHRLDPTPYPTGGTVNVLPREFHGYRSLAFGHVLDAAGTEELLALVRKGIEEQPGYAAACFNPRHGVRVKKPQKTFDLVICFECYAIRIFDDGMSHAGTSKGVEAAVNAFFDARLR